MRNAVYVLQEIIFTNLLIVPVRSLYAQFEASCAIDYEPEHAFVDVRPITRDI